MSDCIYCGATGASAPIPGWPHADDRACLDAKACHSRVVEHVALNAPQPKEALLWGSNTSRS